jgi:hypothetical protein
MYSYCCIFSLQIGLTKKVAGTIPFIKQNKQNPSVLTNQSFKSLEDHEEQFFWSESSYYRLNIPNLKFWNIKCSRLQKFLKASIAP